MNALRLVYVVTHPVSAALLLRGQLAYMRARGFDVTVVASPGPDLDTVAAREGVRTVALPMARETSPKADLVALVRLVRLFRELRPHIVNASTPKAGLLGMIAARITDVPVRVYLLRGLRLETAHGALRTVLETTERLAAACAHDVVCVSRSLREAAVKGGYVAAEKAHVLGDGSSNGVDASRFRRDIDTVQRGRGRLEALGVPATARIVGFVGRLVEDKGIAELLAAFRSVLERVPNAWLVLVGDELGGDHLARHVASELRTMAHVAVVGRVDDLAPFYSVMDVLAFPSHREGFPNVPLEAACMAVPTVGFASTGVVDAVVDSVTGTLVERGDVRGLADALTRYLDDEEKRRMHGAAAQRRALASFDHTNVWGTWASHYMRLATDRGLLSPA